jgi:hypothetical protein
VECLNHSTVSPAACFGNSLDLQAPSGYPTETALDFHPYLLEVTTSSRFFCGIRYYFRIATGIAPLMEFLPHDTDSLLGPLKTEVIASLRV